MTQEEYEKRFHENAQVTGEGLETTMHMPCPFCAAADFLVHHIIDTENAYEGGAVCGECGRGAKAIFTRSEGNTTFEFVQTMGDDPPDFLPRMRRMQ